MTAIAYDFAPYSPRSRKHYEFAEAGEEHLLAAEIQRTHPALFIAADAKEKKGQLTRAEVDRIDAIWPAIGADLEAAAKHPGTAAARLAELRQANGIAWAEKVAAMRAELERRRRDYPADVDKGRLAPEQARAQLEALEAVHFLYWHLGFAFDGTREQIRAHANAHADYLEQQAAA